MPDLGMSLEFVNRICPNCKNPNYMVSLGDYFKAYGYKCLNCNRYFNNIDFEPKEIIIPKKRRYSEQIMDDLVDQMVVFLKTHKIHELMDLITSAIATHEQE